MEFTNFTPFPALAFQGLDQHQQDFHVLVLRQTLSFATGTLMYADEQAPLCEEDEFFGAPNLSSVRQESDLCHYKPRCDVLVNATAVAPGGTPVRRFDVRLRVHSAAAAQGARSAPLLDKTLTVHGARDFVKTAGPTSLLKMASLGLLRPAPWELTAAQMLTELPLRHEAAYGGQCRIEHDDQAAQHVPKAQYLTPEQQTEHPNQPAPLAHTVCDLNPLGVGYSESWYLKATRQERVPAPQIEAPAAPLTAALFYRALDGKLKDLTAQELAAFTPAGMGVVPKGHPTRRRLAGTVDEAFAKSDQWLPDDFDFAVWNAAPVDQQLDYLQGDEVIELTNLCAPAAPGATQDAQGNTLLQLTLPGDLPFVLVHYPDGRMGELRAVLDTVIIDPERNQVSCVWRATVGSEPEVAALEFRMLQKAAIQALKTQIAAQAQGVTHGQ